VTRSKTARPRLGLETLEAREVPAVITVTTTADNTAVDGKVSLREAITSMDNGASLNADVAANVSGTYGPQDEIHFNIAGSGVHTIKPGSALPAISDGVTIDGYTQPGAAVNNLALGDDANLRIALDGSNLPLSSGLDLETACTVRGLVIEHFGNHGINVNAGNVTITGNFIGVDATGTAAAGNASNGVAVFSGTGTVIGGPSPADRNVISGNGVNGITLTSPTLFTRVEGNYIGTDHTGTIDFGNKNLGIYVAGSGAKIGFSGGGGAANIISGNDAGGIVVITPADSTLIAGNFIGLTADGGAALGNGGPGIEIAGATNTHVGTGNGTGGNTISGNAGDGVFIHLTGATGNTVQGNSIGLDGSGLAAVPNASGGVEIFDAPNNLIGGSATGQGNVISGNGGSGIVLLGTTATGNTIAGNAIGISPLDTLLANASDGIKVESANTTIGGTTPGSTNLIATAGSGRAIFADTTADNTQIIDNLIGVDSQQGSVLSTGTDDAILLNSQGNYVSGNVVAGYATGVDIAGGQNSILGNHIGTDNTDSFKLPNGVGIAFGGSAVSNFVGGTSPDDSNTIAHNTIAGVQLGGLNEVLFGNSISDNHVGIDTTNAQHLLAAPTITQAINGNNQTAISGTIHGAANFSYVVELFANPPSPTGDVEGLFLLDHLTVNTDANGDGSFTDSVAFNPPTTMITATLSGFAQGTSGFSDPVAVQDPPPPPNAPPSISDIANQSTTTDVPVGPLGFTVSDAENPADSLIVTAMSSNPALVPDGNIVLAGIGGARTVTVTPAAGQTGTTTITLTVTDASNLTATDTFVVIVNPPVSPPPPNTPPSISDVADQQTLTGLPVGPIDFTVSDTETPAGNLVVTADSSAPALIPSANVVIAGSGGSRTVTVTPAAGQAGMATITLTVTDADGASATDTFDVTVTPPESPPPGPVGPTLVVSGSADGAARGYVAGPDGTLQLSGGAINPFPGFAGDVRAATGDFNGDGVTDTVLVTGPGVKTVMAVVSGKDGSVLLGPTDPFGDANFTFGGFVTAGDIDHDGRAEWVVTPELRGGPRVVIFHFLAGGSFDITSAGQPSLVANFFGIGDPTFRDGDRPALGDVNGDGILDVFSIAAFNGGPRTALYDGADVLGARSAGRDPVKLTGDFFAAPSGADDGRGGRSIAVGDANEDGVADLIATGDNLLGTGNQVVVFSGADLVAGRAPGFGATPIANFTVTGQDPSALVSVAVVNADGDAQADLAVGSGAGQPSLVNVYLGKDLSGTTEPASASFDPFGGPTTNGVFVG
jgi:hypothetical protein